MLQTKLCFQVFKHIERTLVQVHRAGEQTVVGLAAKHLGEGLVVGVLEGDLLSELSARGPMMMSNLVFLALRLRLL